MYKKLGAASIGVVGFIAMTGGPAFAYGDGAHGGARCQRTGSGPVYYSRAPDRAARVGTGASSQGFGNQFASGSSNEPTGRWSVPSTTGAPPASGSWSGAPPSTAGAGVTPSTAGAGVTPSPVTLVPATAAPVAYVPQAPPRRADPPAVGSTTTTLAGPALPTIAAGIPVDPDRAPVLISAAGQPPASTVTLAGSPSAVTPLIGAGVLASGGAAALVVCWARRRRER